MKIFVIIISLFLLFGCSRKIDCIKRVILDKDEIKADNFIVNVMRTTQSQNRTENEDADVFIKQTEMTAIEIYGTDLNGWQWSDRRDCNCGNSEDSVNQLNSKVSK